MNTQSINDLFIFEYFTEHSAVYEFDNFFDAAGNWFSSRRKCYIDALQQSGITDLPFEYMTEYSLEEQCLQNNIYVKFME